MSRHMTLISKNLGVWLASALLGALLRSQLKIWSEAVRFFPSWYILALRVGAQNPVARHTGSLPSRD